MPPDDESRVGSIIQDKYKVLRRIGVGGMGVVYEAENTDIGRRVAIKLLHAEMATKPETVKRFRREARAATAIGHKNIVEILDMGRLGDGTIYMVLEYLEGRDLQTELKRSGALTIPHTIHIFSQICEALYAAHQKGIVHRDLKPENIFLIERDGDPDFVKILDFGVAKFSPSQHDMAALTRTGYAVGTAAYMSPEQAHGSKTLDHRSDIFSLGVILYLVLTARRPFFKESMVDLMVSICSDQQPPMSTHRKGLPDALEDIVASMLEKSPSNRYPDCLAVKDALLALKGEDGSPRASSLEQDILDGASPTQRFLSTPEASDQAQMSDAFAPTQDLVAMDLPPTQQIDSVPEIKEKGESSSSSSEELVHDLRTEPPVEVAKERPVKKVDSRKRFFLEIAGGVVLATVFGFLILRASNSGEDHAAQESPIETPSESASSAELTEAVRIQIETIPREAQLFLDGEPVANPFDAELPERADPYRIEARLEGYTTLVRVVSMRYSQRIQLELQPISREADASVSSREYAPRGAKVSGDVKAPHYSPDYID